MKDFGSFSMALGNLGSARLLVMLIAIFGCRAVALSDLVGYLELFRKSGFWSVRWVATFVSMSGRWMLGLPNPHIQAVKEKLCSGFAFAGSDLAASVNYMLDGARKSERPF